MLPEQLVRQPYLNCLTREQGLELEFGISEDTIRLLEQKGHRPVRVPVDQAMSTMLNSVMYVDGGVPRCRHPAGGRLRRSPSL